MSSIRLLPCGPTGWLAEVDDGVDVLALAEAARRLDGVQEVVPAARTVLVHVRLGSDLAELAVRIEELDVAPSRLPTADRPADVTIDVVYDGEDLGAVAASCGLPVDEVIARHTAPTYRSAFCGFAPGFAYLTGLDPGLHVPRRDTPRTRVPAGSVAIASTYSAVYPTASPGGWQLLGRTERILFDPDRHPPALLAPGVTVRFEAV
jgi:KipI family sensor histidine kinase inhibitor